MGRTTQQFFAEGDQHEANHWEGARLPPDDEPATDPQAAFDSFDTIPKTNRPLVAGLAIGGTMLAAYVVSAMFFGIPRGLGPTDDLRRGGLAIRGWAHNFGTTVRGLTRQKVPAAAAARTATTDNATGAAGDVANSASFAPSPQPPATAPIAAHPTEAGSAAPLTAHDVAGPSVPAEPHNVVTPHRSRRPTARFQTIEIINLTPAPTTGDQVAAAAENPKLPQAVAAGTAPGEIPLTEPAPPLPPDSPTEPGSNPTTPGFGSGDVPVTGDPPTP